MKKISALLIAAVFILSLAACGSSDKGGTTETGGANTSETAEKVEATAVVTEADDDALIKETREKLIGNWSYTGMEDFVRLTFNEDGTGSYKGLDGADFTFTYAISMVHKTYNNGDPYIDQTLTVNYSTGETEEIVIIFREDTGELTFSSTDRGSYSGVITYYGGWKRI